MTPLYVLFIVIVPSAPPTFRRQPPRELTAIAGDDVILPCDVVGHPDPVISWRKNHSVLARGSHKYQIDDSGSLVIKSIRSDDAGQYVCLAENSAGIAARHIALSVHGQQKLNFS